MSSMLVSWFFELLYSIHPWFLALALPLFVFLSVFSSFLSLFEVLVGKAGFQGLPNWVWYVIWLLVTTFFSAVGVVSTLRVVTWWRRGVSRRNASWSWPNGPLDWAIITLIAWAVVASISAITAIWPSGIGGLAHRLFTTWMWALGIMSVWWYLAAGLSPVIVGVLGKLQPSQKTKRRIRWRLGVLWSLVLYPLVAALGMVLYFSLSSYPQGSQFGVVHAAIKNTCLLDPQREHCPQRLEDIEIIEPREYQQLIHQHHVKYGYNPISNEYTLMVRYAPNRVVVFDQRLKSEVGIDVAEYYLKVLGRDCLINPPDFLPINQSDWCFPDWPYADWQYTRF